MQPIRNLLDRIRWDEAFGRGDFRVGYYDRLEERVIEVPFRSLRFPGHDHFSLEVTDAGGVAHTVPLHRICSVRRDGELIWHRSRCDGTLSRRRKK